MSEEIIITAKTLDEAIAKAEAEYSGRGSISYDILEMPKKGFLGFGSTPAKIKVTITPENDILGENRPLYTIDRTIAESGKLFNDGMHIIYVNSQIRDDTPG